MNYFLFGELYFEPYLIFEVSTHLGSQWAIVKSKASRVTNMSVSSRTSWTLGGGRAIASPMKPIIGTEHFFVYAQNKVKFTIFLNISITL